MQKLKERIADSLRWIAEIPYFGAFLCTIVGIVGIMLDKDVMGEYT